VNSWPRQFPCVYYAGMPRGMVWRGMELGMVNEDEMSKRGKRERDMHTLPAVPSPLPTPVMSARRRGVSCRIAYDGALAKPLARL
jgi:hypothetical protein